jgi:hypothetical protein
LSYDTVWVDVPKVVTEFVYNYDTVTISKDSVIIRFAYDTVTRKVFIEADCPDCPEITKTERIEIPIIKEDTFWQCFSTGSKGFGLAIFLGLVLWLIKNRK